MLQRPWIQHARLSASAEACSGRWTRYGWASILVRFTNCVTEGELERVGRGLYRLSTAPHLTNPDWVTVAIRAPRAVVCLISALAHHGMTTQVPHSIDLAIPSHGQIPKVDALPIRVFWYSEPAFSAGVELVRIDEVSVRIYSAAKTVADCFKYRNKIGLDIAVEALRRFRERKKKPDFRELVRYARICRVERIMRPYLEATL